MIFQQFSIRGLPYCEKGGVFNAGGGAVAGMEKKAISAFKLAMRAAPRGAGCGGAGGNFAKSFERTYARMLAVCHTVLLEEVRATATQGRG